MRVAISQVLQWLCLAMRRACASFGDNNVGAPSLPASVCLCSISCFASTTVLVDSAGSLSNLLSVCQLLNHLICTMFALCFVSMYFRMEGRVLHHFLCPVVL
jgi:hypothetical protein